MITQVQERVNNVLNYINENPNSDPNAYEMVELTFDVGKEGADIRTKYIDAAEGYNKAISNEELTNLRQDYFKMMEIRLQHLVDPERGLNVDENSPLYKMINQFQSNIVTYNRLASNDSEGQEYKKMCSSLAGVSLYIKQRQRDLSKNKETGIIYDNKEELDALENFFKKERDPNIAAVLQEIETAFMKETNPQKENNDFVNTLKGMVNTEVSLENDETDNPARDIGSKEI